MLAELALKSNLYLFLQGIEVDLAEMVKAKGCPQCGGRLDWGRYERKPRGGPPGLPKELLFRHSLCCGCEGCRSRTLPPSVLFMGRRVYWGAVILLVTTLRQGWLGGAGVARLMQTYGMTRQTVKRWMAYFREMFPTSRLWQAIRGRLNVAVRDERLPGSLLAHFIESSESEMAGLIGCLRFLATGGHFARKTKDDTEHAKVG